ncbi:MAG: STAS/SEC14 domain-containing protein [Desulfomonile sp.]|nr:STAS/SEC14 domain-containing protein [Desulfomonile sp.]
MIEILPESHNDILAVRGSGKLTKQDYEEILLPRLEEMVGEHSKIRFLFYMDRDFEGWEPGAAWDYAKFGFRHRNNFSKVAGVCGPKWVEWEFKLKSLFTGAGVKTFPCDRRSEALEWIEA